MSNKKLPEKYNSEIAQLNEEIELLKKEILKRKKKIIKIRKNQNPDTKIKNQQTDNFFSCKSI